MARFGYHNRINLAEIDEAFTKSLWRLGGGRSSYMRLGFAISGGVDSMALAYLWKLYRQCKPDYNPFVRSFVIDHGLRVGSAEEARLVASRLEPLLGRPGQIITLNWDKFDGPAGVTSIETTARHLRFRALAAAAYQHGIEAILFGHHADDSVETAIHRISQNSRSTGIPGLKAVSNVPECSGLYGIDQSGNFERLQVHSRLQHFVGGPEKGGLVICRPLLQFPKLRLAESCKKAGIKWVEDKTNKDLSLTPRNVIRSMLETGALPKALRTSSIKTMIENIKQKAEERESLVKRLYDATHIRLLDMRSGTMEVYLPNKKFILELLRDYQSEESIFQAFARLLNSLLEAVSPDQVVKLADVKPSARVLFEHVFNHEESKMSGLAVSKMKLDILNTSTQGCVGFRLSRNRFIDRHKVNTDHPSDILLPPIREPHRKGTRSHTMTIENTQLWDGRWWMSVLNHTTVPLRISALHSTMLPYFKSTRYGPSWSQLDQLWKEAAPSFPSRWSIPAIICNGPPPLESMIPPSDSLWSEDNKEKPVIEPRPQFEIFKYPTKLGGGSGQISKSIPVAELDPDMFDSDFHLSRRPQSEKSLVPTPKVYHGQVDGSRYPMPEGPFLVAIPTLGIFLNNYWADHLQWNIHYKKINLADMQYISRYRMEKPVIARGVTRSAVLPRVV